MRSTSTILQRIVLAVLMLGLGAFLPAWTGGGPQVSEAPRREATIPPEARQTLAYVRAHREAPPGYVGGRRFGNYEKRLPLQDAQGRPIDYQEWDIHPKVPGRNRGAQRLITGSDGRAWYTGDHYATFTEIREP